MKLFKNTLIVVALFTIGSAYARTVGTTTKTTPAKPAPALPKTSFNALLHKVRGMNKSAILKDNMLLNSYISFVIDNAKASSLAPEFVEALLQAGPNLHNDSANIEITMNINKQIQDIVRGYSQDTRQEIQLGRPRLEVIEEEETTLPMPVRPKGRPGQPEIIEEEEETTLPMPIRPKGRPGQQPEIIEDTETTLQLSPRKTPIKISIRTEALTSANDVIRKNMTSLVNAMKSKDQPTTARMQSVLGIAKTVYAKFVSAGLTRSDVKNIVIEAIQAYDNMELAGLANSQSGSDWLEATFDPQNWS